MDRAARYAERKASVAGLLTAALTACATVQAPPGGPPDFEAPVLLETVPATETVVPSFDDDVEFRFNEVVDERSGGNLANLIRVSPRHDNLRVSWKRNRVTVKPGDGWHPSETYTVTLLPGLADLRQNRFDSTTTIVFSTGGGIPNTRAAGNVINWQEDRFAAGALIELIRPQDSVTYIGTADSSGAFEVTAVPPGQYILVATIDENRNGRREGREAFDSTLVRIDSTANFNLWAFAHDTLGPTVRALAFVDSQAIASEFTQYLNPDIASHNARVLMLPDSTPVAVAGVLWRPVFDSLRTAQQDSIAAAVSDSIAAALQDSVNAVGDSIVSDSILIDSADVEVTDSAAIEVEEPTPPDSATVPDPAAEARAALLRTRPRLYNGFVVLLEEPLIPGASYVVEATAVNPLNIPQTSARSLLIPTPADST